jgi:hypothetical protein
LCQIIVIQFICQGNEDFVPTVNASLVSADEQDCVAARVKGVKDAIRFALMLNAQFTHLTVLGAFDVSAMGKTEIHAQVLQQPDRPRYGNLHFLIKGVSPRFKLIRVFNFPFHSQYSLKVILLKRKLRKEVERPQRPSADAFTSIGYAVRSFFSASGNVIKKAGLHALAIVRMRSPSS